MNYHLHQRGSDDPLCRVVLNARDDWVLKASQSLQRARIDIPMQQADPRERLEPDTSIYQWIDCGLLNIVLDAAREDELNSIHRTGAGVVCTDASVVFGTRANGSRVDDPLMSPQSHIAAACTVHHDRGGGRRGGRRALHTAIFLKITIPPSRIWIAGSAFFSKKRVPKSKK
jgi:hypothetical protein